MSRKRRDISERFWEKVDKSGECWIWLAGKSDKGYGSFGIGKGISPIRAHRYSYEETNGPIPTGLVLDHLCGRKDCVRPSHLEPVSNAENLRRGDVGAQNAAHHRAKTHCRNGHEYTEDTVRMQVRKTRGVLVRMCLICYDENVKRNTNK
jgi:HNH endonuclease